MVNNIKYRQLKAFCLAAEEGSFNAAARLLCVSQPAFTALIKHLEDDLNMQLFIRTTRSCRLTPEGESLYETMNRALSDLEEVYQYAKEEGKGVRGKLSIASVPSLSLGFLAEVLGAFHRSHPLVHIYMSEHTNDEVIEALRRNQVELGIGRASKEAEFEFIPLLTDRLLLAAPEGHPLLSSARLEWRSLAKHRLIMIGGGATAQEMELTASVKSYSVEATHLVTALSMVRHGMGVAVIPSSAAYALGSEGLHFAPIHGAGALRQLGAVHKRRRRLSASARHFIDQAKSMAPAAMRDWDTVCARPR
ncbi:MAG TPA: LysR family transcriptional regulator [Burkholderiaceae bacterium]|nr:LysR family transcriptional regulator [Burkholderiaceae bacterium]